MICAMGNNPIDTTYNFRLNTPEKLDPDKWSATLCEYHRLLWSKILPDGNRFDLVPSAAPFYLNHREFCLSSDTVVPTFRKQKSRSRALAQISDDMMSFGGLGYTIGGMMVFPAKRIGRKITINGARGFHPRIKDRFDLTVECIRRHYRKEDSPLGKVLARYAAFFDLFENFQGYVEFFLLQDLVDGDFAGVKFFLPFDNFKSSPVPDSAASYFKYRENAMDFLKARNRRIQEWANANLEKATL